MKKIIVLILLMVMCLTGCAAGGYNDIEYDIAKNDYRMIIIYDTSSTKIYVDTITGVQYLKVYDGGVTVMVDENGEPLIYEEVEK